MMHGQKNITLNTLPVITKPHAAHTHTKHVACNHQATCCPHTH